MSEGPYIFSFNSDGQPTNEGNERMSEEEFDVLVSRTAESISDSKRILIFIHGGLTNPKKAIVRSRELHADISNDDTTPIFIVWDSRLFSSYFESLFWVRRGVKYRKWIIPILTLPFAILEDLARGIGRFLHTILIAMGRDSQTNDKVFAKHPNWFPLKERYRDRLSDFFGDIVKRDWTTFVETGGRARLHGVTVDVGGDLAARNTRGRFFKYWAMMPFHLAFCGLLDSIGKRAWDNMRRRTRTMTGYNPDVHPDGYTPPLIRLFCKLGASCRDNGQRIDMIGHSMGTIVINELFRRLQDIPCSNIVFLAAACSVRGFNETVGKRLLEDADLRFYNVCLHPRAEVSEYNAFSLVRGSLLAWIDNFFADPIAYDDRTLGSFENCICCFKLLPADRDIVLRSVRLGDQSGPEKHGTFSDFPFWIPEFWGER